MEKLAYISFNPANKLNYNSISRQNKPNQVSFRSSDECKSQKDDDKKYVKVPRWQYHLFGIANIICTLILASMI